MIAVLGGLGAACAWATSTLCSSRSTRLIDPPSVVAWIMLVGLLITVPLAAVHGVPESLHGSALTWLMVSAVGNVVGLVIAYRALRIGQVAIVAPIVSTEGAIAAMIAVLAGETLAPGVGVTLGAIAVGVCLSAVPAEDMPEEHRERHPQTVALAVLGACAFGVSLYATGRAGTELPSSWVVLSARVVGTVTLAIPLALTGRLHLTRRTVPLVLASGVCEVLGFFSFTAGARHGIAVAAVLSSQFASVAAVAAYVLFGERLSRIQLAGVCTVIAGVAGLSALRV
ncbi:MAG TPA: DMT family transporter [Solirubrobacteraceae bacterium]|nr:DMT family transporter [Solirubrobacteraceae bacterium]